MGKYSFMVHFTLPTLWTLHWSYGVEDDVLFVKHSSLAFVLFYLVSSQAARAAAIVAPRLPIGRPGSLCIVPGAGSAPIGQLSSVVHLHLTTSLTAQCAHISLPGHWTMSEAHQQLEWSLSLHH